MDKRKIVISMGILLSLTLVGCGKEAKTIYSNAKGEMTVEEFGSKSKKEPYRKNGFVLKSLRVHKVKGSSAQVAADGSDIVLEFDYKTSPESAAAYDIEDDVMWLSGYFSLSDETEKSMVNLLVKDSNDVEYSYGHEFELKAFGSTFFNAYVRMRQDYKLPIYYELTIDDQLAAEGVYTGAVDELGEKPSAEEAVEEAAEEPEL